MFSFMRESDVVFQFALFEALKQLQKVKLTPQVIEGRALKDGDKDEQ